MAKFEFSLEAVLEQRGLIERRQQVVVAQLQAARDQAEARVRALQGAMTTDREAQRRLAKGDAGGRVAVDQVRLAASASMHALVSLQRAALALAGAQQRLGAGQDRLRSARVERKGVEVLKQRQFDAWKREQARREAAELDDLVVMRAGRADGRESPPGGAGESDAPERAPQEGAGSSPV